MADLIDTTEMYLRTVFELEEEGTTPLRARIAERLEQSGPTVSQTVSRMERDGLLHVGEDRVIRLSATGRHLAARVMRKHRVAECMLVDLLNLDPASVHAEACRWEHVISDDVELRVLRILGNPTHSPFGNPIPALASLDPSLVEADESVPLVRLADAGDAGTTRLVRIDERAQEDANLLARMSGFQPGDTIDHRRQAGDYLIAAGHGSVTITAAEAQHLWVHPETED